MGNGAVGASSGSAGERERLLAPNATIAKSPSGPDGTDVAVTVRLSAGGPGRQTLGGRTLSVCLLALCLLGPTPAAQTLPGLSQAATPAQPPEQVLDPLGRTTPRGTVLGFLNAARRGDIQLAREYLNTRLTDAASAERARQLFVVLDARLPARLTEVSDAPEGSRANPLAPNQEVVGTIESAAGPVEIVVERVVHPKSPPIWLFSADTLDAVPPVYQEILGSRPPSVLPSFLFTTRLGSLRLVEWLAILLGLPIIYLAVVVVNRILTPVAGLVTRRMLHRRIEAGRSALPLPARVVLTALTARWVLTAVPMSLFVRQLFSSLTTLALVAGGAWLVIRLNAELEQSIRRRVPPVSASAAAAALLRVGRRTIDVIVIVVALLVTLRYLGVNLTPVLAGLGVGGIAVALAAQKTLENVIAGASLIVDQAVRIGDFLRVGTIQGTVVHIGLRSTRIRTLDRTMVTVPNSQIANLTLETLSARDTFWFHHIVGLRYETAPDQLRAVLDGVRRTLHDHHSIDDDSIRVRFVRLGPYSLEVDVFAYAFARDWNHFLEIQEVLLFEITDVVMGAGTAVAFPSQTVYVEGVPAAAAIGGRDSIR